MKLGRWFLMGTVLTLAAPLFAQSPPCPAEIDAERDALFAQADADGNGTLSLAEFKTFESLMRDKMTEHQFNRLDTTGDGVVSLDELKAGRPGPGFGHPPF